MFLEESVYWVSEQSLLDNASGKFAARILVIVNTEAGVGGQPIEFIEKVLTAAKIELAKDTALLSIEKIEPIRLFPFPETKKPDKILVFGVEPAQLGLNINFQWYQPFVFSGVTFLFSEKISLLEADRDRKMKLWNALKSIFLS
jgi:hypothetical protein